MTPEDRRTILQYLLDHDELDDASRGILEAHLLLDPVVVDVDTVETPADS